MMFRNSVSVLLLSGVSMAYAAPPAKPILEVETQKLTVEARWSAVGATGYRLFTAPHDNPEQVDMVDMGNSNQITAVMDHGTAMHVYVQAYNEDGDSPFSELKSFVLVDPTIDKTPEQLKPEAQSLAFQAVFLDTPVAFLPDDESAAVQEDTVRQARTRKKVTYGPEFDEGRISMTVHIAPALVRRESVELALCLGVEDVCEPLEVWNSEQQQYTETLTVYDLPDDIETNVYLELRIPAKLRTKLLTQSNEAQTYVVYASNLSGNHADELVQVTEIPVINLGTNVGTSETRRTVRNGKKTLSCRGTTNTNITDNSTSNTTTTNNTTTTTTHDSTTSNTNLNGIKCEKDFGKKFDSGSFGVEFETTPEVWIYKTAQEQGSSFGASLGATGSTNVLIYGDTSTIIEAEAFIIKNKGQRLTRQINITFEGLNIASITESRNKGNWTNCRYSNTYCSEQPESDDDEGNGGNEEDTKSDLDTVYKYSKSAGLTIEKRFLIVFVPIVARLEVGGSAGVELKAGLEINTTSFNLEFKVEGGPTADLGLQAQAGVTILIVSGGVGIEFTFIENTLNLGVTANLNANPSFEGHVMNELKGPEGEIYLWAEWYEPKFALPPWEKVTENITLLRWAPFDPQTFILLSWTNGRENKAEGSDAINSGSYDGKPVPVIRNTEPADDEKGWVCLYTEKNFQGKRACFALPENKKEVAFNADAFGDWPTDGCCGSDTYNLKSLKIWGPLRVTILKDKVPIKNDYEFQTGGAAWYAKDGQIEYVNYVGSYLFDEMASVIITKVESGSHLHEMEVCFYENSDHSGNNFCDSGKFENDAVDNYLGSYWNDRISSISIKGLGAVVLYEDTNYEGDSVVHFGIGGWINIYLSENWKNEISSYKLYPITIPNKFKEKQKYVFITDQKVTELTSSYRVLLSENVGGNIGHGGAVTSMFLTNIVGSGRLVGDAYECNYINVDDGTNGTKCPLGKLRPIDDVASAVAMAGPLTLTLKNGDSGRKMVYHLDEGEWDVAYLYGFNDDTRYADVVYRKVTYD